RFDRILKQATRVITASTERLEIGGISYEFCNELMLGLGTIRARQLDTDLIPLAVWNRMTGDGPGGAASAIELWRSAGYEAAIVDLPTVAGRAALRGAENLVGSRHGGQAVESRPTGSEGFGSRIVAILFADAVGFSKLSEPEVPRFVQHFLGMIAGLSKKFGDAIIAKNTW